MGIVTVPVSSPEGKPICHVDLIVVPGKRSRLLARTVGKSVMCLSSQLRENRSIVMSVSRSTKSQDINFHGSTRVSSLRHTSVFQVGYRKSGRDVLARKGSARMQFLAWDSHFSIFFHPFI